VSVHNPSHPHPTTSPPPTSSFIPASTDTASHSEAHHRQFPATLRAASLSRDQPGPALNLAPGDRPVVIAGIHPPQPPRRAPPPPTSQSGHSDPKVARLSRGRVKLVSPPTFPAGTFTLVPRIRVLITSTSTLSVSALSIRTPHLPQPQRRHTEHAAPGRATGGGCPPSPPPPPPPRAAPAAGLAMGRHQPVCVDILGRLWPHRLGH
jgi:hypothetical protein